MKIVVRRTGAETASSGLTAVHSGRARLLSQRQRIRQQSFPHFCQLLARVRGGINSVDAAEPTTPSTFCS
ncbi:hypothetical protein Q1695_004531 [Nippostrongylus brasiliensis]|nr:hypothetical protein Q1695_004531 [Nippostrongylus brasiliensis]